MMDRKVPVTLYEAKLGRARLLADGMSPKDVNKCEQEHIINRTRIEQDGLKHNKR